MKFRSDVDGLVTGVRFYKGAENTGAHVGTLWSATGTKLATATFTGESASSWQLVTFAAPVHVTAGTTYVASYHMNTGHYAYTYNGLANGVDHGVLHALASATSGGNGVFAYTSTSGFPLGSSQATNYWVDITFTPAS